MRSVPKAAWRAKLSGGQQCLRRRWRMCRRRLAEQLGQTLAEYAMLLGAATLAVVISALVFFQDSITTAFSSAADCVQGTCVAEQGGDGGGDDGGGEDGDDDHHDDHDDDHHHDDDDDD